MTMPEGAVPSVPSARVVGNAFVEQYYHILHQSPGLVHRFYQDSSLLSRPDNSGDMTTVTTTQAINEKILSLKYEEFTAEIKTADAQESYSGGVVVVVTGCLTAKDTVRRNFTQTFFLAPQEKGYFVLNDVFRYIEETALPTSAPADSLSPAAASAVALPPEPEPVTAPDQHPEEPETSFEEEELSNGPEVCDPSGNEDSVTEEEGVEVEPEPEPEPPVEDDSPKKSYAAILKVVQSHAVTRKVHVPSSAPRAIPAKDPQPSPVKPSVPATSVPISDGVLPENSNVPKVEGYSIYVRNLPFDATVEQLEEVFKKFGPVKPNGIQVRSNKGSCFGFVEFESVVAMQGAIEASPVAIGGRRAPVEAKRATAQVGTSGRGRFPPGRGGFRNEGGYRGRGNFNGGRGYGRTEYRSQGDFRSHGEYSPRSRGPPMGGHGGEVYRPYQNGRGRGGRGGLGHGPDPA